MNETINGFWFGLGFSVAYCAIHWTIYLTITAIQKRRALNEQKRMVSAAGFAQAETKPEPIGSRPH